MLKFIDLAKCMVELGGHLIQFHLLCHLLISRKHKGLDKLLCHYRAIDHKSLKLKNYSQVGQCALLATNQTRQCISGLRLDGEVRRFDLKDLQRHLPLGWRRF